MKMKKLAVFGLAILALATGITGCGAKEESSSSSKKTEITYAIWDQIQQPGMKELADEFMKENKNINVKVQVIPWDQYWTKLEASANGQTLPDVFWMHGSEADRYMKAGTLLDISDSYKKEDGNYPDDLGSRFD